MRIFCLDDFKVEFEKLISKKSYRDLQRELINYFFDKSVEDLKSGTRLNNDDEIPYIKKRLRGSGGYRCYFLLIIIKDECLYLIFVHPKTGPSGSSNITDESKTYLSKYMTKNDGSLYMSESLYVTYRSPSIGAECSLFLPARQVSGFWFLVSGFQFLVFHNS